MVGLSQVLFQQYTFDDVQASYVYVFKLRMDLCAQVRSHVRTLQTQAGVCVHIPNSRVYEYGNL